MVAYQCKEMIYSACNNFICYVSLFFCKWFVCFSQPKLGWTEAAMVAGARDVDVSPSIVGGFPRKEAALVEVQVFLHN